MQTSERLSLEQIQAFLDGSGEVGFKGQNREEVYGWVNETLRQQRYEGLKRSQRGWVRRLRHLRHPGRYRQRTLCPVRHRRTGARPDLWRGREGRAGKGMARKCHLEGSAGGITCKAGRGLWPLPYEEALPWLVRCPELLQQG